MISSRYPSRNCPSSANEITAKETDLSQSTISRVHMHKDSDYSNLHPFLRTNLNFEDNDRMGRIRSMALEEERLARRARLIKETSNKMDSCDFSKPYDYEDLQMRYGERPRTRRAYENDRLKIESGYEDISKTESSHDETNVKAKPILANKSKDEIQEQPNDPPKSVSIEDYNCILKLSEKSRLVKNIGDFSNRLYSLYIPDNQIAELLEENGELIGIFTNLPLEELADYPAARTIYFKSRFNRSKPSESSIRLSWNLKKKILNSLFKNREVFSNFPIIHSNVKTDLIKENNQLMKEIFDKLTTNAETVSSVTETLVLDLTESVKKNTRIASQDESDFKWNSIESLLPHHQQNEPININEAIDQAKYTRFSRRCIAKDKSISTSSTNSNGLPNGPKKKSAIEPLKHELTARFEEAIKEEQIGRFEGITKAKSISTSSTNSNGLPNGPKRKSAIEPLKPESPIRFEDFKDETKGRFELINDEPNERFDRNEADVRMETKTVQTSNGRHGRTVHKFDLFNISEMEAALIERRKEGLINKPLLLAGIESERFVFKVDNFEEMYEGHQLTKQFPFNYSGFKWVFFIEVTHSEEPSLHPTLDLCLKLKTPLDRSVNVKAIISLINKNPEKIRVFKRFLNFCRCEKFCNVSLSKEDLINNKFVVNNQLTIELELRRL